MVLHALQPSLNGGEIAPALRHRSDLQKFSTCVKEATNFFAHPEGGMSNRAGTEMLAQVKEREYTYQETVQLYGWGVDGYDFKYFTLSATPDKGDVVYDETKAKVGEVALTDFVSEPNTLRLIIETEDTYITREVLRMEDYDFSTEMELTGQRSGEVRLIPFEFDNDNTYVLEFGDRYIRFFTPQGQIVNEDGTPYEIESPFAGENVWKIRARQLADVMYIAWGGKPHTLTRYGHAQWRLEEYDFKNGPFEAENSEEKKQIGVVFDKAEFLYKVTASEDLFAKGDEKRLFYVQNTFKGAHWAGEISSSTPLYISEVHLVAGGYEFHTKGTWTGTIKIEYSKDKVLWKSEREFSSYENFNADFAGNLEEGLWWVRVSATITNGTCTYTLDTQSVQRKLVFEVKTFVNSKMVWAFSKEDIVELGTIFEGSDSELNVGEILNVIPTMTSATEPAGVAYGTEMPASSSPYLLGDGLPYPAWQAFGADAQQRSPFSRPAYFVKKEESGVLGYEPAEACYVNKITFYGAVKGRLRDANISLDSLFSSLKIKYRLNQSIATEVNYSSSVELLERQKFENDSTTTSDNVYIHNVKITLTFQTVLTDDFFLEFVASSAKEVGWLGNETYWDGGGLIYGMKAFGFKYVAGQEIANNFFTNWAFGLWGERANYPTDIMLYQDRVGWVTKQRQDFSKIGLYDNFATSDPLTDDDSISVTLVDQKMNKINSVAVAGKLVAFTSSGNHTHNQTTMTPATATFDKDSEDGSGFVDPAIARGSILYVSPTRSAISDFQYNFQTDGYIGNDITLFARHLFKNEKVKEMAFQAEPDSLLWVVTDSGKMLVCTYLKQENVLAWSRFETKGKVKSVCVLSDGNYQNLYLAVERESGTFVEKMPTRLLSYDTKEQFFVDCGRTYRGEPAQEITGLDYLEGQEVAILADGQVQPRQVVQNGQITLQYPASVVHVGIPYESTLKSLSMDFSAGDGTMQDRRKRYVAATVFFADTVGGEIGAEGFELDPVERPKGGAYNEPSALRTFSQLVNVSGVHEYEPSIVVKQSDPLPMTVTGWIPKVAVGG